MSDAPPPILANKNRSNWVRLRTLVILRWVAIAGQFAAILVGQALLGLSLEMGPIYVAIGASAISNLVPSFIYPENKRLSETELLGLLIFDITQLSVLLSLTGGLNNPFALLMLAPVTISATALRLRSTLTIGALAILLVTFNMFWHLPLMTVTGEVMQLPPVFVVGFWLAIVIGVTFQAAYARRVTSEVTAMSDALTATQMALSREQKLTDLGGVVAAAAHELGTPLATIALVSGELVDELDDPAQREDAQLIRDQANRCRDILRSMGRAGKDDLHLRRAPVATVVEEAAEPHRDRGKTVLFDVAAAGGAASDQPVIERRPEIIHGVRNLIQNAVDFAAETVWVDIRWTELTITLRISDDGTGYPSDMLPRLGDPFLRRRRGQGGSSSRPGYEGMGLGLFIAKTLLERSGAELSFANGRSSQGNGRRTRSGAMVEVVWRRDRIAVPGGDSRSALGDNRPIEA